jgi:acyl-CoA reductase-like NAD-dependent aldehyde dehydrogenase
MGPVVNKSQLEKIAGHVDRACGQGVVIHTGGQRLTGGVFDRGLFYAPTVMTGVGTEHAIFRDEVFGPVVAVTEADGFDHAIQLANAVDVGLSASLVTREFKNAMVYAERIQAGVVKVNQISTGLALQAPFGGVKQSSTDSFKEQGASAVDFYSRIKTVYLDYSV